jgi:hypothetical protein
MPHGRLVARAVVGLMGMALMVAGCSAAATSDRANADSAAAGKVALAYSSALFHGDLRSAGQLVEPGSQSAFGLVAAGLSGTAVHANGLADGRTVVTGHTAVTTLVGDLCRSGPKPTAPPTDEQCVSNRDPKSTNPIFTVTTARQPDGRWLVTFSAPDGVRPSGGTGPGGPPAATENAQPSS